MRDQAGFQADEERVAEDVVAELVEKVTERNAEKDGGERQQQEDERDAGGDGGHRGEQEPAQRAFAGSPKPARLRSIRPRFDSTLRMNARASTLRGDDFTIAIW